MKTRFTPGPWRVVPFDEMQSVDVGVGKETIACVCGLDYENRKANGSLIAAAPDMYEALESLLDSFLPDGHGAARSSKWNAHTINEMRALLKKARGEV